MKIATGRSIGPEILRLLDIDPKRCRRAVITLERNEAVIVDCEFYAQDPGAGAIEILKKKFEVTATEIAPPLESGLIETTTLESEFRIFDIGPAS